MKNNFYKLIRILCCFIVLTSAAFALDKGGKIVKLTQGQWVRVLDMDPSASASDFMQIWLHRGTLIYGVIKVKNQAKKRDGITYLGLPVRFELGKEGSYLGKDIINPGNGDLNLNINAFHLRKNVFCPGSSSEFILNGECTNSRVPVGEGYEFGIEKLSKLENGNKVSKISYRLDEDTAKYLNINQEYSFEIYNHELETLETKGVLFRLDRPHPQKEIVFVKETHITCGGVDTNSISRKKTVSAYMDANIEAKASFFTFLSATFKTGLSTSANLEEEDEMVIYTRTDFGTTITKWGYIIDHTKTSNDIEYHTPFKIEKIVDCDSKRGNNSFGDRIQELVFYIFNHEKGSTPSYEFKESSVFQNFDNEILGHISTPAFISANNNIQQTNTINLIKDYRNIKEEFLANFFFSQMNISCPSGTRKTCKKLFSAPIPKSN